MRRSREAALIDFIGEMYRAAGEPAHWPEVLARFSSVIDCAALALYVVDQRDQSVPLWLSHGSPEIMEREYAEYYLTIDPRTRYGSAHMNRTVYDYLHITEAEIDRSEYYDWHRQRGGFRYYIGAGLAESSAPGIYTAIGVQRTPRQGHVDEHEVRLFDLLLPHLRQAVALSTRLVGLRTRVGALTDTLHQCGTAMILLDRHGQVMFTTAAAEQVLSMADGITIDREGRLRASQPSEDVALQRLIEAVSQDDLMAPRAAGGDIALSRSSRPSPVAVSVRRLRLPEDLLPAHRPAVTAVTIRDPGAAPHPDLRSLRSLFGLTAAEAALAGGLAAGCGLRTYAEDTGISYETARWHLKNVFAKTGTTSQAHLVRLVLKTATPGAES